MKYWKYLWVNSWIFFVFLGIVGLFILFWVIYQDDYGADVRNTLLWCGGILAIIMGGMYYKWRQL